MKIGIYSPFSNICGGGEKYVCKIAELLSEENNVEFIIFKELNVKRLENRLNVNLSKLEIEHIKNSNLFNLFSEVPYLRVLIRILRIPSIVKITKKYDLFINQEHFPFIPSMAKKSILICEVPPTRLSYHLSNNLITNLIFNSNLKTYDKIVVNSFYTKKWTRKYYKNKIEILYPPIDTEQFSPLSKQNIILSVGRFFIGGHCKKQFEMIVFFKQLYKENKILEDWEYHLVGGLIENIKDKEYLEKCKEEARNYPVYFHINVAFQDLKELYGMAKIFWHATGFNEDKKKHPERMEHFGITTGEAMSAGCVPVVINRGGQPEIVRNLIDGFLWNNTGELKKHTLKLISNNNLWQKMSQTSIKRSLEFGINKFRERVKLIINDI